MNWVAVMHGKKMFTCTLNRGMRYRKRGLEGLPSRKESVGTSAKAPTASVAATPNRTRRCADTNFGTLGVTFLWQGHVQGCSSPRECPQDIREELGKSPFLGGNISEGGDIPRKGEVHMKDYETSLRPMCPASRAAHRIQGSSLKRVRKPGHP